MRRVLLLLGILLLILPSCAPSDEFEGGRPLSREELEAISAELFTAVTLPETAPETELATRNPDVVYWTDSGSVYHADPHCHYLKNADFLHRGSIQGAWKNGKEKPCSSCCKE